MHDKDKMGVLDVKAAVDAVKRSNINVAHAVDEHLLAQCAMMAFDKGDFETLAESMSYDETSQVSSDGLHLCEITHRLFRINIW